MFKTTVALMTLAFVAQTAQASCPDLSGTYVFDGQAASCSKTTLSSLDSLALPTVGQYEGVLNANAPLVISQSNCSDVTFSYESLGSARNDAIFTPSENNVEWKFDGLEVTSSVGSIGTGNIRKLNHFFSKNSAGNLEVSYDRWNFSPFFGISHDVYQCTLVKQ